jgi:hypothetical protein
MHHIGSVCSCRTGRSWCSLDTPLPKLYVHTAMLLQYDWLHASGWFCSCLQDGQELVFTYHHILESEAFIMAKIRELGPFDGICGFSQVCAGCGQSNNWPEQWRRQQLQQQSSSCSSSMWCSTNVWHLWLQAGVALAKFHAQQLCCSGAGSCSSGSSSSSRQL